MGARGPGDPVDDDHLLKIATAFAAIVDAKSPWTYFLSWFEELAPLAAAHHERLDGSGYPSGLTADDLTLPMRVLAVADAYEALTAARPYRPALEEDEALATIRVCRAGWTPTPTRRWRR